MSAHRLVIFTGLSDYPRILNLASIAGEAVAMQNDSDVVALWLNLNVGAKTMPGVSSIQVDLSAIYKATFAEFVDYLNAVVKPAYNLLGTFMITPQGYVAYDNIERFTRLSLIEWDLGTFSRAFNDTAN